MPDAEIVKVQLRGTWDWQEGLTLTGGDNGQYAAVLDLSNTRVDQSFKLVVNENKWLGHNMLVIDAPEGWVSGEYDGSDFVLNHDETGYNTYNVTATWVSNPDATANWTVKLEGKDEYVVPEEVDITSVTLRGNFNNWEDTAATTFEKADSTNWTMTLDLTDITANQEFKLCVNQAIWVGYGEMTINAPEGWVEAANSYDDSNIVLKNATTGYQTYTMTAHWQKGTDAKQGWTLTIAGKDERQQPIILNDYTVTFVNGKNWEEVYAYAWTGSNRGETELASWPGKKKEKKDSVVINDTKYNVYSYTFQAPQKPDHVIFHNLYEQTPDLTFQTDSAYTVTVPISHGEDQMAIINSVELRGEFNDWSRNDNTTFTKGQDQTWTLTLNLSGMETDQKFKLVVNDTTWIGYNSDMVIDAPEGWIIGEQDGAMNYILKNSITGYETYILTATWTENVLANEQWTLKIEGKDKRIATGIEMLRSAIGRGSRVYNLQGAAVDNVTKKGIYIIDGKKVVVR